MPETNPLTPAQRQARRYAKGVQIGLITDPEAIAALRQLQAQGLTMREAVEQSLVMRAKAQSATQPAP